MEQSDDVQLHSEYHENENESTVRQDINESHEMEWWTLQEEAENTLVDMNGRFPPGNIIHRLMEHQRNGWQP